MASITRRTALRTGALLGLGMSMAGLNTAADSRDYVPAVPGRPIPGPSGFGPKSTADEVTAGIDLSGMTALVTGCNSGIGYETMRALALRGAHVFGAARNTDKAETACARIKGTATPIVVELTEFETIVSAGQQIRDLNIPLDMLILNAGVMAIQELELVNGIEKQFVTNHLGHFLLTEHLLDNVKMAPSGRVVVVSSSAHSWASEEGIEFENLNSEKGYDPFRAYGQSKLANGLFSRELARRLAETSATSNSLHPGDIDTNLDRNLPQQSRGVSRNGWKTIPEGAATTCFVATHPDLKAVTGYYFADSNMAWPDHRMQNDAMAKRLWQLSLELTEDYRLSA